MMDRSNNSAAAWTSAWQAKVHGRRMARSYSEGVEYTFPSESYEQHPNRSQRSRTWSVTRCRTSHERVSRVNSKPLPVCRATQSKKHDPVVDVATTSYLEKSIINTSRVKPGRPTMTSLIFSNKSIRCTNQHSTTASNQLLQQKSDKKSDKEEGD